MESGALGHLSVIAGRDGAADCILRSEELRVAITDLVVGWFPVGICNDNSDHVTYLLPSIVAEVIQDLAAMRGIVPEQIEHAGPFDGFLDGYPARYNRWQHTSTLCKIVGAGSIDDAYTLILNRMANNIETYLSDLAFDHLDRQCPGVLAQIMIKANDIRAKAGTE
jgi:hypothetical protein